MSSSKNELHSAMNLVIVNHNINNEYKKEYGDKLTIIVIIYNIYTFNTFSIHTCIYIQGGQSR